MRSNLHLRASALYCAIALLASGCAGRPGGATDPGEARFLSRDSAAPVVRGEIGERVDEHLRRAEAFGFSGVVLVDAGGDVVLHKGYGLADRERALPMHPETIHAIGSITKQFTGAAIVALEEDGELSVDDPIARHLPDVPADKAGITIHQLLTHTAGIRFAADFREPPAARDEALREILAADLGSAPGERHHYSNAGYALLGAIVELASGMPYERYLIERLFQPAGMERTGFSLPRWPPDEVARGYGSHIVRGTPLDRPRAQDGSWGWHDFPAGGLLSTAGDLRRWVRAIEGGAVLGAAAREKWLAPYVPEDESGTSHYGYGWARFTNPWGTPRISHDGGTHVSYANLRWYPVEDVILVFATNDAPDRGVDRQLPAVVFGRKIEPLPAALADLSEAELSIFAGIYLLPTGESFEISLKDGQLSMDPADPGAARLLTSFELPQGERERAARAEALAAPILDGLARGDLEHWEPVLSTRLPLDGEPAYWRSRFSEWSGAFGAYRGAEVVGTRLRGELLDTYTLLRFERGHWLVRLEQDRDDRFDIGVFVPQLLPQRFRFVPESQTTFVTYNLRLSRAARLRFVLDEHGAVRGASFDGPSGPVTARRVGSSGA